MAATNGRRLARRIATVGLVLALLVVTSTPAAGHAVCAEDVEFATTGYGGILEIVEHREAALERVELTTTGLSRIESFAEGCYG